MTTDAATNDAPENGLQFGNLADLFPSPTPTVPGDDEAPDEVQPKTKRAYTKRASKKANAGVTEAIGEMLAMGNAAFMMIAPCSCVGRMAPAALALGAHFDTCPRAMMLTGEEADTLTKAIEAEFDAHPEWAERINNLGGLVPHIMLAFAVFSIVIERRARSGQIVAPEGVDIDVIWRAQADVPDSVDVTPV